MAELNYWELSDEFIADQLKRIHEIMKKANKIEDIEKIETLELKLLQEQRHRMNMMLQDETEAAKLSLETSKAKNSEEAEKAKLNLEQAKLSLERDKLSFETSNAKNSEDAEKVKFKVTTILKILEIVAMLAGTGATVYSAKANLDAKKIECTSRERNVDRITALEESGEIPYQQANKSKFI